MSIPMETRSGVTLAVEVWAALDRASAKGVRYPVVSYERGHVVVKRASGEVLRMMRARSAAKDVERVGVEG